MVSSMMSKHRLTVVGVDVGVGPGVVGGVAEGEHVGEGGGDSAVKHPRASSPPLAGG